MIFFSVFYWLFLLDNERKNGIPIEPNVIEGGKFLFALKILTEFHSVILLHKDTYPISDSESTTDVTSLIDGNYHELNRKYKIKILITAIVFSDWKIVF